MKAAEEFTIRMLVANDAMSWVQVYRQHAQKCAGGMVDDHHALVHAVRWARCARKNLTGAEAALKLMARSSQLKASPR